MNPLFNAINGKSSVQNVSPNNSNFMQEVMTAYKSGKINEFGEKQFQENPQFRQFIETMKGKNPFQVAKANGIDLTRFMK